MDSSATINAPTRYTPTAIVLHWTGATTILAMLFTAFMGWSAPSQSVELYWIHLHGSIGVVFGLLVAARIIYHFNTAQPRALTKKPWEYRLSRFIHKLMLVFIALQLLTGPLDIWSGGWAIDVFGWFEIPSPFLKWNAGNHDLLGTIHTATGVAIGLFVLIHVAATFKHHLIDRDQTLRRMLGIGAG